MRSADQTATDLEFHQEDPDAVIRADRDAAEKRSIVQIAWTRNLGGPLCYFAGPPASELIDVGVAISCGCGSGIGVSDLSWLMISKRHGRPRGDDRRVLSGIVFWGPHKTLENRWKRWGAARVSRA